MKFSSLIFTAALLVLVSCGDKKSEVNEPISNQNVTGLSGLNGFNGQNTQSGQSILSQTWCVRHGRDINYRRSRNQRTSRQRFPVRNFLRNGEINFFRSGEFRMRKFKNGQNISQQGRWSLNSQNQLIMRLDSNGKTVSGKLTPQRDKLRFIQDGKQASQIFYKCY